MTRPIDNQTMDLNLQNRRTLASAAILLVAYTATAVLSLQWATVQGAGAAVWIPAGVGIAGLFLGGVRLWPAILIGRLAAGFITASGQPFWAELIIAAANAFSSVLAVWLVVGRGGTGTVLHTLPGMLRFIWGAGVLPAALAALIGTVTLYFSSGIPVDLLPSTWLRWASANAAAVLVVTPLLLNAREPLPSEQRWHFVILLAAAAVASSLIFLSANEGGLRTWHIYPILIWSALAFSVRGAAAALLIVELVAVIAVMLGRGPIASVTSDPIVAFVHLHQFLILTSATVLVLAAVADERRDKEALERAQKELRQLNEELESRVRERTEVLRRAEEALLQARKMEAIGQLTGGIAHDFNNLLQTISGSLELISRIPASPSLPRWVETAKRATASGARLTGQLLAFSRMQKLELEPVAVAALIEGMVDMLRSTLGVSVRLELRLGSARDLHVLSDRTQLELMILNLAVNARDAMPEGGILTIGAELVTMQGQPDLADDSYVRIFVRDTGVGMAPEVIARAFDPFFTTKAIGKGTGLGLSMVYGVAKQSGGRASIASQLGGGTTVSVLLPSVEAHAPGPTADPDTPKVIHSRLEVLLVDDDDDVRETTASMLRVLGMEVREARSGVEALERVEGAAPDLILLDYAMPGMNGAELARRLRQRGVESPILMVTGYANAEDLRIGLGANASLLPKPFGLAELGKAIASLGIMEERVS